MLKFTRKPMKRRKLSPVFFAKDTSLVAKAILGKFLVRRWRGREIALMITEVEAYDGTSDRASHARHGKTARNSPMFGKPGHWYVYFTYGMHWLINIVTREKDYPAAVLIRGGIAVGRNGEVFKVSGPARAAKFLKVTGKFSGLAANTKTGFWIEERRSSQGLSPEKRARVQKKKIRHGPRVGINYAGKIWAAKPWRYWID
jgi:DNA-3-methyladenine glycosylase